MKVFQQISYREAAVAQRIKNTVKILRRADDFATARAHFKVQSDSPVTWSDDVINKLGDYRGDRWQQLWLGDVYLL